MKLDPVLLGRGVLLKTLVVIISKIVTLYLLKLMEIIKGKSKDLYGDTNRLSFVTLMIVLMMTAITMVIESISKTDLFEISVGKTVIILSALSLLGMFIYEYLGNIANRETITETMKLQDEYTISIENSINELNGLRHDYANHLIGIYAYVEYGEYDKLHEYVSSLISALISFDELVICDHLVVSSILNAKHNKCKSLGIELNLDIHFDEEIKVEDIDVCVLIGNMLDNAIEATLNNKSEKRFIDFKLAVRKNWLLIDCENYVEGDVRILKKGYVQTSKKDKRRHGFGLRNIRKVCEKYLGEVYIDFDEQIFSIKASIPNMKIPNCTSK